MSRLLSDLDLDLGAMAERLLHTAKQEGIKLIVTQTYRTAEEQQALYDQGRKIPGRIVTNAPPGYSWHEFRRAFDVAIKSFAGDTTPKNLYDGPWELIGDLGEEAGLEWGGRWKHPDLPHFQHTGGKTLAWMRGARKIREG